MGDKKESETTDRQKGDEEERSSRVEESFSLCINSLGDIRVCTQRHGRCKWAIKGAMFPVALH